MNPTFLTGDPEWEDYDVEVGVRPLSLDDMAGVVFRYHTNRHYTVADPVLPAVQYDG
jgi:rhamnogalacturonan endolyase